MPTQITHRRLQGRHPEYARPRIKCGRIVASPANDAEKEVPRVASCQKEEEMKKVKKDLHLQGSGMK